MASCLSRLCLTSRLGGKTMRTIGCRGLNTSHISMMPKSSSSESTTDNSVEKESSKKRGKSTQVPSYEQGKVSRSGVELRFKYPEMFPEPHMIWRNPIKEKLERKDMLARRSRIYIPEFYVGSVLRVSLSNFHQADKTSTFVGICIQRNECGLKANFILRNVIDNLGVEVKIELYDPRLLKIEVLRLEKRLDTHLRYLRDAPHEFSTFPLDMKPEIRRTDDVPLNRIKVKLNPRPWTENWYKYDFKGIDNIEDQITNKMNRRRIQLRKPWEKYDMMKTYRETLPEEEINEILSEIKEDVEEHEQKHRRRIN
ncbi:39S ribosomal protein L19, mitochondrial [Thrips palmi]|uniref:Large ribosomal subunit protein bL19m n=1 Tax=Thrips palmi TaxID=161013 RepID=A0A6P9ABK3_THRPL|nr:39S ribosomal protein L19, mitochondrial [Thrips palmi]